MSGWSEGFNAATMAKQSDSRSKLAWAELAAQEEEKLKRESDAGKAAEYFFKANPEAMAATGISEQQFANMSAREQSQAAMGFVQSQATKKIMQELADQKATQTANTAFGRDMSGVYGRNAMQTLAQGNGPVNPPAVGMDQLAAGLSPEAWQSPQAQTLLRELAQGQGAAANPSFYSRSDVGKMIPVEGADGYGLAVTGPNQAQAFYTGKPQGSAVNVPGVGDVGVITTKPGQTTIVPGQTTQGQIREALAKSEADIAKLKTKLKADPELTQYLGGALAEQESLAASYRAALGGGQGTASGGQKVAMPAVGEVRGGYRFKGGNPKDKENWEAVQ